MGDLSLAEALSRLPSKPFLTTPEVAHALGVHAVSVFRFVQRGLIERRRVRSRGRKSLYPRGSVEAFIRSRLR